MFVCLCKVVTERQVENAVQDGANSIAEVSEGCGAGSGCGSCHEQIQEIIDRGNSCTKRQQEPLYSIAVRPLAS